jgi:hypothetical protein
LEPKKPVQHAFSRPMEGCVCYTANIMTKALYLSLLLAAMMPPGVASAHSSSARPLEKVEFRAPVDASSSEWRFIQTEFPASDNPNQVVSIAEIDLNGDGVPEHAFFVTGSSSCGGGNCDLAIYKDRCSGRRLIFNVASGPLFYVLRSKVAGYHDIGIPRIDPTPGKRSYPYVIWSWNGQRYQLKG